MSKYLGIEFIHAIALSSNRGNLCAAALSAMRMLEIWARSTADAATALVQTSTIENVASWFSDRVGTFTTETERQKKK